MQSDWTKYAGWCDEWGEPQTEVGVHSCGHGSGESTKKFDLRLALRPLPDKIDIFLYGGTDISTWEMITDKSRSRLLSRIHFFFPSSLMLLAQVFRRLPPGPDELEPGAFEYFHNGITSETSHKKPQSRRRYDRAEKKIAPPSLSPESSLRARSYSPASLSC